VQPPKLGSRLSDHVALADEDLVGEVRHRAIDAAIRPAHDDVATARAVIGLFDPDNLHDRRLDHDRASLAWAGGGRPVRAARCLTTPESGRQDLAWRPFPDAETCPANIGERGNIRSLTSDGRAYASFRRALLPNNPGIILPAAAELPYVSLADP
jgi:hypothetical protein